MPNEKYKISEEGVIYSLNDDGSISQLGKIEDGKVSVIEGCNYAGYQTNKKADSIYDLDGIYKSFGDIFENGMNSIVSNTHTNESLNKKEAIHIDKEELLRLETKISKVKISTIDGEYFDNVLLHLIDGFIWGRTSRRDIRNCIYKESTYYYYLNNSKTLYLCQNKNYKVFHTFSIDNLKDMPEPLISALLFDESYSLNQWLTLIKSIGLSVKFNSREDREIQSFFGEIASKLYDPLGMLVFESNLFSITLNLNPGNEDALRIVKSICITYKLSPEKSFLEKLF